VGQADPDVELAGPHGVRDGAAPQRAGVTGDRVGVRQGAGEPGGLDHRLDVVQVGERDGAGAHERAVAGRTPGAAVQVRADLAHGGRCRPAAAQRVGEHRPGLDADVGRPVPVPAQEALRDALLRCVGAQVRAGGRHLGDAERHLGVVAPLTRRDPAEPAAEQLRLAGQRRTPNSYGTPSASPAAWPTRTPTARSFC
jgi:hypothetical protein